MYTFLILVAEQNSYTSTMQTYTIDVCVFSSVLTGSKEAGLPDMREAVCIDLCTGQVSKHEADCGEEILAKLGRTAVVGDHWSFRVTKERLDLVDEIEVR